MSGRKALFADDAFTFDFSDTVVAEPEVKEAETAAEILGSGHGAARDAGPASLDRVQAAKAACVASGYKFLSSSSRDEWPELRQRHRDCVARAVKRLAAARTAGKKQHGRGEKGAETSDDE
jgi:hypothetical protein